MGLFNGTSAASQVTRDNPVRAERANYYDAGISQTILPGWNIGLDGYYKTAEYNYWMMVFGSRRSFSPPSTIKKAASMA